MESSEFVYHRQLHHSAPVIPHTRRVVAGTEILDVLLDGFTLTWRTCDLELVSPPPDQQPTTPADSICVSYTAADSPSTGCDDSPVLSSDTPADYAKTVSSSLIPL